MKAWMVAVTLGTLIGCKGKEDDSPVESSPPVNPDAPVVDSAEVTCMYHDVGTQYYYWIVQGSYSDAQGADDVEVSGHDLDVLKDGGVYAEINDLVICKDGNCTGNFTADTYGVPCDDPESWDFKLKIYDLDGNEGSLTVTGSKGF